MTRYRMNGNGLEWWNEEKKKWETVTCQNAITSGDSCYRGCSAFEKTTVEEKVICDIRGYPAVRLSCGCGRTIRLEEANDAK